MHRTKDIHPVVRRILFPVTLPPSRCCRSRELQNNMEVQFFLFCIAATMVVAIAQEMTIPVGVDGKDTLTTIRNVDVRARTEPEPDHRVFPPERPHPGSPRADEDGYRAELLTNEPGVSSAQPANVTVTKEVEPDPVALALGPTAPLQWGFAGLLEVILEGLLPWVLLGFLCNSRRVCQRLTCPRVTL
ncbi:cuticle protein 14 isoform b [Trichonephila inaurata madagascariensis]|uniref:Cuticle protein 14 isoform b n=1 Tax=Trichonephila inaurata madagascariensis TaxID=2747483 RepID=A0A8X6X5Z0_9ARAC|nr:cuticle protein 14 isoform b [Trichonephila inaurata madagascariensis]